MGYYLKTLVGAVLFLGAVVAFNVAVINLLQAGTCASGNTPYEIAKPCPEGTGAYAGLLTGSFFAGLIGAGIFAFRGDRPGGKRESLVDGFFGWGLMAWGIFFGGSGLVIGIYSATADLPADGRLGGIIVGVTFGVMGLPVLLWGLKEIVMGVLESRRGSSGGTAIDEMRASMGASGAAPAGGGSGFVPAPKPVRSQGGGDAIAKIERLDALRKAGALSESEFQREKAKILAAG